MSRTVYRVLPDKEEQGAWVIEVDGSPYGSQGNFKTKTHAVDVATSAARRGWEIDQQEGQVVVHGNDGKIQDERTYGNDPTPPAG